MNTKKLLLGDVNIIEFIPNSDWAKLDEFLKHSKTFRNSFWFTSAARFLALRHLSEEIGGLLHIESDVILSDDFPFTKISESSFDFLFPVVSQNNAIASCLYLKDSKSAGILAEITLSAAEKDHYTTDMYILSDLTKNSEVKFAPLPTAPSQFYDGNIKDKTFLQTNDQSLRNFKGVFDGFDLGRYLFGDDPRNKRGIKILRENDPRTYLNARKLSLILKPNRDFPFIVDIEKNKEWPIFSLHIHSKNTDLFRLNKSRYLIKKAVEEAHLAPKKVFVFSIFLSSFVQALKRRINRYTNLIRSNI
jgi:hypothetical protein